MESDSLLIAGNASSNAWKIAKAWPGLEPCITKKLLSIPSRTFIHHGKPSPECGNIMVRNALECFAKYFDFATDKAGIIDFIEKAEANDRPSVARKAHNLHKKLQSYCGLKFADALSRHGATQACLTGFEEQELTNPCSRHA